MTHVDCDHWTCGSQCYGGRSADATTQCSPKGSAQVQVLGKWVKGDRPAFTLGREQYQGGKWIEITYGRPLQRGRDLFGSGANYGKSANDVGTPTFPAPPVWRAGANMTTQAEDGGSARPWQQDCARR